MNVNIKISLTDIQRNTMARGMDHKNTKRMVTRADVNELVSGFIAGMLDDAQIERILSNNTSPSETDLSKVPARYTSKPDHWKQSYLRGRYRR